jgi:hypothetical protein
MVVIPPVPFFSPLFIAQNPQLIPASVLDVRD